MLWLGALMALVACGGGESLTYDESMDLLASAMERTIASEYSAEGNTVYVVDMGDSLREYTYSGYEIHHKSSRNFFSYHVTRNPLSPPEISKSIVLEGKMYEFVDADRCYSHDAQKTVSASGTQVTTTTTSEVQETSIPDVKVTTSFTATSDRFGSSTFDRFGPYTRKIYRDYDYSGERWVEEDGSSVALIEFESDPDFRFSFKVRDGYMVESKVHSERDNHGKLVRDGFDDKIVAKKTLTRYYNIGVRKEFPVPEPICE